MKKYANPPLVARRVTPREELTIRAYVEGAVRGVSQFEAYAKYNKVQDNRTYAMKRAGDFFRLPRIAKRLRELMDETISHTTVTTANVLTEVAKIAFSDRGVLFDDAGTLLPVKKWPAGMRGAVSSVKVVETIAPQVDEDTGEIRNVPVYTKEVKFWEKNRSLDMLGKYLGMFEKDNLQKAGISSDFERLSPEVRNEIRDKLRAIAGLDKPVDASGGVRTTH